MDFETERMKETAELFLKTYNHLSLEEISFFAKRLDVHLYEKYIEIEKTYIENSEKIADYEHKKKSALKKKRDRDKHELFVSECLHPEGFKYYEKPKSTDSKQPGCSEEKVKAIEDAMRHFQMI